MKRFVLNELVRPSLHRAGTAIGSVLTGLGLAADDVQTVIAAVTILCGLGVDLIIRRWL